MGCKWRRSVKSLLGAEVGNGRPWAGRFSPDGVETRELLKKAGAVRMAFVVNRRSVWEDLSWQFEEEQCKNPMTSIEVT